MGAGRVCAVLGATVLGVATFGGCTTTTAGPSTVTVTRSVTPSSSASRGPSSAPAAVRSAAKPPATWASTFTSVSTGVVRIDDQCDSDDLSSIGTGTGFLIAPNMVATVAHVVEDDGALRVTSPTSGLVVPGQVIGIDHDDDLALVRTADPLPGHVFSLARSAPAIGSEIGAIGFPLARSMQLTIGHITGTHDHRRVGDEFDLSDVVLSDAALNPGNSGGPWLTKAGQVVALDESGPPYDAQSASRAQGNNGGVPAATAYSRLLGWMRTPTPQADRGCQPDTQADAAIETLELYFYDIDTSDYASAYAQLDSDNHPISGLDSFVSGVQSSTDEATDGSDANFTVTGQGRAGGRVYVDVTFRSEQHAAQGPHGETCTIWTLRYTFLHYEDLELIHSSPAVPGTPGNEAC